MAIQQLDLFGNPVTIQVIKEEPAKVAPSTKADPTPRDVDPPSFPLFEESEINATSIEKNDNNDISQTSISSAEAQEKSIVYSDSQIRVKIKPKKEVVEVKDDSLPEKKKRGRKKAAPRKNVAKGSKMKVNGKEVDNKSSYLRIPDDETLNQKLYWGISEVAIMFGVANSLIRFWTNEFAILKPRKGQGSHRFYKTEDIRTLEVIYDLIRIRQFSIDGAKKYLANNREQIDVQTEVIQSLTKFKTFLIELKSNLGA